MTVHFIYAPKSGSRIFVSDPTPEVFAIEHLNGSCHVIGGIELKYEAAGNDPAAYWRPAARQAAVIAVNAAGGYAVDECGTIRLIVPIHMAWAVNELMIDFRRVATGEELGERPNEEQRNLAALLAGGAAELNARAQYAGRGVLDIRPLHRPPFYFQRRFIGVRTFRMSKVTFEWCLSSLDDKISTTEELTVPAKWVDIHSQVLDLDEEQKALIQAQAKDDEEDYPE